MCSADSGERRAALLCLRYYKAFPAQRPFFDFCASCDTRSIMRGKFGIVPNANDRTRTTEDGRANAERAPSASRAHIMPMIDRAAPIRAGDAPRYIRQPSYAVGQSLTAAHVSVLQPSGKTEKIFIFLLTNLSKRCIIVLVD